MPVSYSQVEVEYDAEGRFVNPPADPMITQVIMADQSSVFTYAIPKAGCWGFAALDEDDKTMSHAGKDILLKLLRCFGLRPMI